jgi:hypothetical protein
VTKLRAIGGRNPETRMLDRRCRCGVPAAVDEATCQWHPAASARYASDLQETMRTALGGNETIFERLRWLFEHRRRKAALRRQAKESLAWTYRETRDFLADGLRDLLRQFR